MKKLNFIFIVLLLFAVVSFGANTDRFYQGTVTENTVGFTQPGYTWVVTLVQDSTDQLHSPAIFIGDMNSTDGYVTAITSAASDINVIYHCSADGVTWYTAVTPADFDALSNSTVQDTIGIEEGTDDIAFHIANWLIIEVDGGSSAANLGETVTLTLAFNIDFTLTGQYKPDVTEVRTKRSTGWTNP